jgi:hypothetical protein
VAGVVRKSETAVTEFEYLANCPCIPGFTTLWATRSRKPFVPCLHFDPGLGLGTGSKLHSRSPHAPHAIVSRRRSVGSDTLRKCELECRECQLINSRSRPAPPHRQVPPLWPLMMRCASWVSARQLTWIKGTGMGQGVRARKGDAGWDKEDREEGKCGNCER